MPRNLLVTMSGGTTTVINATLTGIVRQAMADSPYSRVLAGVPGIVGLLNGSLVDLTALTTADLERLRVTPGSASIGTTRVSILSTTELHSLAEVFEKHNIGAFVNIGGNGTIKQTRAIAAAIGDHVQVAAAPKTVDNDLGDPQCREVFFTPGFPSCVNHWAKVTQLLDIENAGAASHDRVLVAQTFGRETGFLAGAARITDPERLAPLLLLLPEDPQPIDAVLSAIEEKVSRAGRVVVIMSEGYPVGDVGSVPDATGQTMYGSSRTTAAQLLVEQLLSVGIQARSYIPTILQRQAIDDTLQCDLDVAAKQGAYIVQRLSAGDSGFLATVRDPAILAPGADPTGAISFKDFTEFSRRLHGDFIAARNFDVTDKYLDYLNRILQMSCFESRYGYPPERFLRDADIPRFFP
jgi:ATP-dependent phosphofructokinase / diphosphate-dependent phosphofructokinase